MSRLLMCAFCAGDAPAVGVHERAALPDERWVRPQQIKVIAQSRGHTRTQSRTDRGRRLVGRSLRVVHPLPERAAR